MRLIKTMVCPGLLFLSLLFSTNPALGGDKNQAGWDKLRQLSAGEEIQVVQNDAKSSRGRFRSVSDDAIVIGLAAGEQTISRQSVLRVSSKGKGHRMRNALIGFGIGAGAGAGIGAGADASCTGNCSWFPNLGVEIFTPVGAIVGGVVGAVVPTGGWHEIYRAR
jgi:hypothetical protein